MLVLLMGGLGWPVGSLVGSHGLSSQAWELLMNGKIEEVWRNKPVYYVSGIQWFVFAFGVA